MMVDKILMVDKMLKKAFKIPDFEDESFTLDDEYNDEFYTLDTTPKDTKSITKFNDLDIESNTENTPLNQILRIFEQFKIESNILSNEIEFYIISNTGEAGLTRTVKEYRMDLDSTLEFLINEYNLEYCPSCGMYEKEIVICEHCGSKVCKKNCAILNPGDNNLIDCKGDKIEELKKYNILCDDCCNSIINYNNDSFYNRIRTESNDNCENLIRSWMKECNLYATEPKKSFYSLYFDDDFSEKLICREERYGHVIKEIVEYYVKNKINPVLEANKNPILRDKILSLKEPNIGWEDNTDKTSINFKKVDKLPRNDESKNETVDKDIHVVKNLSNISPINNNNLLGKAFKKEDLLSLLNLVSTEELLFEIKSIIIKQ